MGVMRENGEEARGIRLQINAKYSPLLGINQLSYLTAVAAETNYVFKNKVRTNGPWDLKRQPEWKKYDVDNYAIFKGEEVTAEDLGNIHFGYVGNAIGLCDIWLRIGAGGYQQYEQIKKALKERDPDYLKFEWILKRDDFGNPALGDHPDDVSNIIWGIKLYNEDN